MTVSVRCVFESLRDALAAAMKTQALEAAMERPASGEEASAGEPADAGVPVPAGVPMPAGAG